MLTETPNLAVLFVRKISYCRKHSKLLSSHFTNQWSWSCNDLQCSKRFKAPQFYGWEKKIVFGCEESGTSDTDTGLRDIDLGCDQTTSMLLNEQAVLCHGWNVALINSTEPLCDFESCIYLLKRLMALHRPDR